MKVETVLRQPSSPNCNADATVSKFLVSTCAKTHPLLEKDIARERDNER